MTLNIYCNITQIHSIMQIFGENLIDSSVNFTLPLSILVIIGMLKPVAIVIATTYILPIYPVAAAVVAESVCVKYTAIVIATFARGIVRLRGYHHDDHPRWCTGLSLEFRKYLYICHNILWNNTCIWCKSNTILWNIH